MKDQPRSVTSLQQHANTQRNLYKGEHDEQKKMVRLHGGTGRDVIAGDEGGDLITGGGGDDSLYGNDGDDEIHGDNGHDEIRGGSGVDTIFGGNGNDVLVGFNSIEVLHRLPDNAVDTMEGNGGMDTFHGAVAYQYFYYQGFFIPIEIENITDFNPAQDIKLPYIYYVFVGG